MAYVPYRWYPRRRSPGGYVRYPDLVLDEPYEPFEPPVTPRGWGRYVLSTLGAGVVGVVTYFQPSRRMVKFEAPGGFDYVPYQLLSIFGVHAWNKYYNGHSGSQVNEIRGPGPSSDQSPDLSNPAIRREVERARRANPVRPNLLLGTPQQRMNINFPAGPNPKPEPTVVHELPKESDDTLRTRFFFFDDAEPYAFSSHPDLALGTAAPQSTPTVQAQAQYNYPDEGIGYRPMAGVQGVVVDPALGINWTAAPPRDVFATIADKERPREKSRFDWNRESVRFPLESARFARENDNMGVRNFRYGGPPPPPPGPSSVLGEIGCIGAAAVAAAAVTGSVVPVMG